MLLTFHKTLCTAMTLDPIIRLQQVSVLYYILHKCLMMDASYFEFSYWSLTFGTAMVQLEQLGTVKVSFYVFMLARTEYSYRILMS